MALIAAPSQPRSSPQAGAALARRWLALAAFFPALPAARLAGGPGWRPGALPVPQERRLPLR